MIFEDRHRAVKTQIKSSIGELGISEGVAVIRQITEGNFPIMKEDLSLRFKELTEFQALLSRINTLSLA